MTKTLFILNDAPYGTERSYAIRLAGALGAPSWHLGKVLFEKSWLYTKLAR